MQKQLTRETSLKLAQILQFVTNVTHMERSVRDVEAYIRKVSFFCSFQSHLHFRIFDNFRVIVIFRLLANFRSKAVASMLIFF